MHEYGGKSYLAVPSMAGGFDLVFANFADQRLYAVGAAEAEGGDPVPLTPAEGGFRYADLVLSPAGDAIWCVRETTRPLDGAQPPDGFHVGGGMAVRREIVAVPLDGSATDDAAAIRVLVHGAQFFAFPTPSPDGTRLAWICWNHPNMPFDGTELRVAPVGRGPVTVADSTLVMGGPDESVLAPAWRDDATLYAVSDASGWWNLYQVPAAGGDAAAAAPARRGVRRAALAARRAAVRAAERRTARGAARPRRAPARPARPGLGGTDRPRPARLPHHARGARRLRHHDHHGSGRPAHPVERAAHRRGRHGRHGRHGGTAERLSKQQADAPDPAYLPDARAVRLPGGQHVGVVHAIVYPPTNPEVTGPAGELPPFIVDVHGGPTSHSLPVVSLETAYFTSRGIGVIDVNYGGSTGYGREYRNRLRGQWGIVDVADAYAAAIGLAEAGEADRARLGIRGGSAGGWTALVAVTTGPELTGVKEAVFAAATSYYGVSDLRPLAVDTHDFESRYLDGLVGPLPEAEELYVERAPVGHVNDLTCPVLLLQGLDDPVVPPSQSEAIAADLAAHGIRHAYIAFAGESHGFRKSETIIAALEAELAFYGAIFGFTPPGVPPVELT